jgi:hypothetical protein
VQLRFVELLLENDAAKAKEILANFTPIFKTKEDYFALMDALIASRPVNAPRSQLHFAKRSETADTGPVCMPAKTS